MSKTPEDHKKQYHAKSETFSFTCETGTVTLPYVENVPRKLAKQVGKVANEGGDADEALFGKIMDKKSYAVLEEMTLGEYDQFTDKWNEESAISMGE